MQHERNIFGYLNGREVGSYILSNLNGMRMCVLEYGCVIQSLEIPVAGRVLDVVLGFDNIEDYVSSHKLPAPPHFGAIIGRYSGRIKNGKFSIGDHHYQLNANNGANTLHGGPVGFDKVLWEVHKVGTSSITLRYLSVDGDENFPGNVDVQVTYTLTDSNELVLEYSATSDADTIINMTQHSYFNLDGHTGNVLDQDLFVNASKILEVDQGIVPTGNIIAAEKVGFDFTNSRKCPDTIDDSFVIENPSAAAATLTSASTGLQLTVTSDQPSVHLYIGGNLFGKMLGKQGVAYHPHSGICFESQNYPDAPNNSHFPSAILRSGETYRQKTTWKFDQLNQSEQ